MKLVILSSSPDGNVAQQFLDAAAQLELADVRAIHIDNAATLLNEDLSDMVILPRIAPEQNDKVSILGELEDRGAYVINSMQAWIDSRDKWRSYELLSDYDIATPMTVLSPQGTYNSDETALGARVIFKPLNGTHGNGIVFVADGDTLPREPGVLQAFIPEAANSDVRLFVVGDEAIAAMRRTAKEGDFRANLHQGASAEAYEPSEAMKANAIAASRALGLEVAGVDILPSEDGGYVIEANPSPGLGIQAYSDADIARKVIEYIATLRA